ncbi:MAG: formate dehydrogenase accessory protein FdhE [Desulfobacterota bacterium]|nr:formate dehydrogenase accessory protein FdhE [Thermodesulfobacteriota bacterium]
MSAWDIASKLTRINQVRQEKPAYKDLLDFYEKIFIAKEEVYQLLKSYPVNWNEYLVRKKFKAGVPILDKESIGFYEDILEDFFWKLLKITEQRNPENGKLLADFIKEENLAIKKAIAEMWQGVFNPEKWGTVRVGDPTLFYFLLIETLKPLYEYLAEFLQELIELDLWGKGYCPICGENPALGAIPKEKWTRFLFCIYCGSEWSFPFLKCPFCENEEEGGIKYLRAGNERDYRLEICQSCQRYLKVVDFDSLGKPVPLDIENIVTLHLDILAQREGYRRGSYHPLLV